MNLIFLDFDEVMNSIFFRSTNRKYFLSLKNGNQEIYKEKNKHNPIYVDKHITIKAAEVDPEAMNNLNFLVQRVNAKVVICSSWRIQSPFSANTEYETVQRFQTLFAKLGYPEFPVIGITGDVGHRGYEVAEFLDEFSKHNKVDNYLIIDDGADFFIDNLKLMTDEEVVAYAGFHNNPIKNPVFKNAEEFRVKSDFWSCQPLLRTDPVTGLTRQDVLLALGHFTPDDLLANARRDYAPYRINQGLYNSQEPQIKENRPNFSKTRPL